MNQKHRLNTAALAYARMGFHVFPCAPGKKKPATPNGFKDATSDIGVIQSLWTQNPNFNVAIETGTKLGDGILAVFDFDPRNGGDATKAKMEEQHGRLPDTARVITGGGGEHLYFVCRPDVMLKAKLGPGIDIKCRGGYVIAAPSIHPDTGLSYEWDAEHNLLEGASIAPLPQWVIDMCAQDSTLTIALPAQDVPRVYVDADTVRDLRSALLSMRADDRDLWIRMGLALRELGDVGRGLWMEWSSQSEKFKPLEAARIWESFK